MSWDRREWRRIRRRRGEILDAAETGGAAGVRELLDDDGSVIDNDDRPASETDAPPVMTDSIRDILSRSIWSRADLDQCVDWLAIDDGPKPGRGRRRKAGGSGECNDDPRQAEGAAGEAP